MSLELELIKSLLGAIGGLIAILVMVIAWIGNRIHSRLDSISSSLSAIEHDLRGEVTKLDRRLTICELRTEEKK